MRFLFFIFCFLFSNLLFAQNWKQIGPRGDYFKDFAIHPTNNQIVFAGSDDSGGIWKSVDRCITWVLVSEEFPDMTGWHIQFDPINTNIIYACDAYGRYGIIKSIDGGENWFLINTNLNSKYDRMVSKIVIDPFNNQILYISTGLDKSGTPVRPGNGIFKSVNGGISWKMTGLQDTTVTCIAMTSNGKIYAGTEKNGVYCSSNNGLFYTVVSSIPSTNPINQIEAKDSVIAVAAGINGVYLSTNYGKQFTNIGLLGEFNFDISIASISPDLTIYSTSTTTLRKYTSSLGIWNIVSSLPNNLIGIGITAIKNEVYYSVFANTEFWHSTDGGNTFNLVQNAPSCVEISSMAIDLANENHIYTSLLGTYSSEYNKQCLHETPDGGINWLRKGPEAHGLVVRFASGSSSVLYCGTFGNGLYKTVNNFNTFTNIRPGNLVINDINVDVQDTSQLFISELNLDSLTFGLYHSSNGGVSFNLILPQIVSSIFNSPTSDSLFIATENGIFISPNNGIDWINLYSGFNFSTITQYKGIVYAGLKTGQIIKAYPSYQDRTGNWGIAVAKTILFKNDTMYLGLSGAEQDTIFSLKGGLYTSQDFGLTWKNITGNLSTTHCYGNPGLVFSNNQLLMSSYSGSVFKNSFQSVAIIEQSKEVNELIIYPNPACKEITLLAPFDLLNVELKIYNDLGILMRYKSNLYNNSKKIVESLDLPNGQYFIIIQNNRKKASGKFIISL